MDLENLLGLASVKNEKNYINQSAMPQGITIGSYYFPQPRKVIQEWVLNTLTRSECRSYADGPRAPMEKPRKVQFG